MIDGMIRQGFSVNLSTASVGWWATFLNEQAMGGAKEIAANAQEPTPWQAVQKAAWVAIGISADDGVEA